MHRRETGSDSRMQLEAGVARLYGLQREEFTCLVEGFPGMVGADPRRVVAAFDALAAAPEQRQHE
jgi:hypothetical protein